MPLCQLYETSSNYASISLEDDSTAMHGCHVPQPLLIRGVFLSRLFDGDSIFIHVFLVFLRLVNASSLTRSLARSLSFLTLTHHLLHAVEITSYVVFFRPPWSRTAASRTSKASGSRPPLIPDALKILEPFLSLLPTGFDTTPQERADLMSAVGAVCKAAELYPKRTRKRKETDDDERKADKLDEEGEVCHFLH